jgi:SAM-dependent methyltransferase
MTDPAVIWHDVECHGYTADLPLWRDLADEEHGPVLDVGAGTGRVALELAAAGHDVTALDSDPVLLGALRQRAAARGLDVTTVTADAQGFALDGSFGVILVPMQTIQLLVDRPAFLAAARAHLVPGGLLAAAIADELVPFEPDPDYLPAPDVGERDGRRYVSQPVSVRLRDATARIERVRTVTAPDGSSALSAERDLIELAAIDTGTLEAEGTAAGFTPEDAVPIPATADHVGSTVVMLRG